MQWQMYEFLAKPKRKKGKKFESFTSFKFKGYWLRSLRWSDKFLNRQIAEKTLYEADKNITVSPETALPFWNAYRFNGFGIAHIYISAIPNPRNPLTESSKITKEIMNTDYRYQFPDNPSLSVNNMPLLRDKDGLLKYTKEPSLSKASPQPLSLFVSGRMTSICSPSRALQIRKV